MKRISKKKLFVAVAAMCLMATVVAAAAGRIAYTQSSSNSNNPTYGKFEDIKKAEIKLGQQIHLVERFTNGAAFASADLMDVECMDENGNKVGSYPQLMVNYGVDKKSVFLSLSKPLEEEPVKTPLMSESYNGTNLNYCEDAYLFLPPDTTPSDADMQLEKDGKLYISEGSAEIERKTFNSVSWKEDTVNYMLFSWDISGQTLFDMAKEVAGAENLK